MKVHRFFVAEKLHQGVFKVQDIKLAHQFHSVLRFSAGTEVALFDGSGVEAHAKIESIGKGEVTFSVLEIISGVGEPKNPIDLYAAILRKENFEWLVAKGTEVGVSRFIPLISERTVKMALRIDRLRMIAREAAEQCGRSVVPEISEPINVGDLTFSGPTFLFDPRAHQAVGNLSREGRLGALIGPEGGWTDAERSELTEKGVVPATLGPLTLRAETAGIIAAYTLANQEVDI